MKKFLSKNKKGMVTLGLVVLFGASSLFGAGDFDNLDKVVKETDDSARKTIGTFGNYLIGFLPFILIVIGILLGFKQAKKQSQQEQEDSNKPAIYAAIGGTAGAIVAILIIALIGAVLMQDSSKGLLVLKNFWLSVFGLAG